MKVSWDSLKNFVTTQSLYVQWVDLGQEYYIKASDGSFNLECSLDKNSPPDTTELDDFVNNYKAAGNKPKKITSTNVPYVSIWGPEFNRRSFVIHDFSKRCSWWQNSVKVTGESLIANVIYTEYTSAYTYWINGDEVTDREIAALTLDPNSQVVRDSGFHKQFYGVYKNDVLQTTGFTLDHINGKVVFDLPLTGSDVVKADYFYSTTATYKLQPPSGKKWRVYRSETQFSRGCNLVPIKFSLWAGGQKQFEKSYITMNDYVNISNLGYSIPAPGGSLNSDVVVLPFDYEAPIDLKDSYGMYILIELENNTPITNTEIATGTLYLFEDND